MSNDRELYRLKIIEGYAQDVVVAWDRLSHCADEFYPEYPGACAEYEQALDEAVLLLMRHADHDRWQRRQQWLREGTEAALVQAEEEERQRRPAQRSGGEQGAGTGGVDGQT